LKFDSFTSTTRNDLWAYELSLSFNYSSSAAHLHKESHKNIVPTGNKILEMGFTTVNDIVTAANNSEILTVDKKETNIINTDLNDRHANMKMKVAEDFYFKVIIS
jgi:hypothetical protein